ncbi:MAG: LPS assembly lipoprotein LptE [Pseudomonadales bacterium]
MTQAMLKGALISALLLLAGCGFQLKGSENTNISFDPNLQNVLVIGDSQNSSIPQRVISYLGNNNVSIADTRSAAEFIVTISPVRESFRTVTVDKLARDAEKELSLMVTYALQDAEGNTLQGPVNLYVERIYKHYIDDVNASDSELDIIRRELNYNLAEQIVRRLQAVKTSGQQAS